MRYTLHSRQRMSQRGIPQRLVDFTLRHGRIEGDRHVLDKGGITVVEGDGAVITTFNRDQPVQQAAR